MNTVPIRPAATVLLVRDEPAFQVLMVRRHHAVDFAAGALVFPGGKLEAGDGDEAWLPHCRGADDLDPEERALRICATREAFEESGIVLAAGVDPQAAASGRARVAGGEIGFRDLLAGLGARLDLAALVPFARWVTPAIMPKRFDTRFYLMAAPSKAVAAADGFETVEAEWVAPAEALRLHATGERTIVFATRMNLQLLAEADNAAAAIESARRRPLAAVHAIVTGEGRGARVTIPPDVGYGIVEPQPI